MDVEDRLARQDKQIAAIRKSLDEIRAGLATAATKLRHLTVGQESLELQTALLSREAEDGHLAAPSLSAVRSRAIASIDVLDKLQRRLDELTQAQKTSAAQAATRTDVLETRVRELRGVAQHLQTDLAALRDASLRPSPGESHRHLHAPSIRDASTEDALRTLGDEMNALRTAGGVVQDRVMRLEKRRGALQESLDGLSLQHVRTDHDTRQLRQQMKRLSVLVAILGLLTAGLLISAIKAI